MTISDRVRRACIMAFHANDSYLSRHINNENLLQWNNHTMFSKYMRIAFNNNTIDVPTFCLPAIQGNLNGDVDEFIVSLYVSDTIYKRTFDSLWTFSQNYMSWGNRLRKYVTNKGEVSYIGKGIIFDESFTPLFMTSKRIQKTGDDAECIELLIRVHPKVFTNPDTMVSKNIVKKLIPAYSTIPNYFYNYESVDFSHTKIQNKVASISITDFSDMIKEPKIPTVSDTQEKMNAFLSQNAESFVDDVWLK